MSTTAKIKDTISELAYTGESFYIADVHSRLNEQGVAIKQGSTIVRSTLYNMIKENTLNLVKEGHGKYRLAPDEVEVYLSNVAQELSHILHDIENFKWYLTSRAEITLMKRRVEKIEEICDMSVQTLNKLNDQQRDKAPHIFTQP